MKRKITFFLLISIAILLQQRCAQPGSLTGGDKDSIPPIMTGSKPAYQERNVNSRKFIIAFNEYLSFDDINNKFLSSPPLDEKPDISMRGKKMLIKIKEDLKDSVTYTFSFEDAVQDYHEGNPVNDFKYVFSTGNDIDSLSISGRLFDAFSQESIEDAYVMLYEQNTDSLPYLEKPLYVARTDSTGNFKIDFIRQADYKIFALADIDANYLYNLPNEKIAFSETTLKPYAETNISTDTIKAGTHLFEIDGEDTVSVKILEKDSVVRQFNSEFFPNTVSLFMFQEDNEKQYIESSGRTLPGKLSVTYNKKPDSIIFEAFNFDIADSRLEKPDTGRVYNWWLTDSLLLEQDSLSIMFSFYNKDSLQNTVLEHDTIFFSFTPPEDSASIKYLQAEFPAAEHDYFNSYKLEFDAPLDSIDKSKLNLFKIIDTLVFDPKKQQVLQKIRPENNRLIFTFARPLVNEFKINFTDTAVSSEVFDIKYSSEKDSVFCTLQDSSLAKREKLNIRIDYDNDFYLNQIQEFSDSLSLTTQGQMLTKALRKDPDTIRLIFNMPLRRTPEIEIEELEKSEYVPLYKEHKDVLKIKLTGSAITKDSLTIRLTSFEGDSLNVKNRQYQVETTLVHTPRQQALAKSGRPAAGEFFLKFKTPYYENLDLKLISPKESNNWYIEKNTKAADSLYFSIKEPAVIKTDTIRFVASYRFLSPDLEIINQTDTISLGYKTKSGRVEAGLDDNKKVSVQIELPVNYDIIQDSVLMRKYRIEHPWTAGTQYKLKADSAAFFDIFGRYNQAEEKSIKVRPEEAYGTIRLKLSGTGMIADSSFFAQTDSISDSLKYARLPEGQLIVRLLSEKKKIVREHIITQDQILNFNYLLPGKYKIKLIFDKNKDGKWNTGNYLKNIKPEQVLLFPEEAEAKAEFENEIERELLFFKYYNFKTESKNKNGKKE